MYASSEENDSTDAENYVQLDLQRLSLGEECRHAGLNGRSNKKADTCYCWWVGGALSVSFNLLWLIKPNDVVIPVPKLTKKGVDTWSSRTHQRTTRKAISA